MKTKLLLTLIISFFLIGNSLNAANYYVATTGSDSNNGSIGSPFATIQKAVNTASSGSDVIYLRSGTYLQSTTINAKNGISITNYTGETVYIQGNGSSYTTLVEIKNSSNITISNITFQNLGVNWAKGILVDAAPCSNITISGNIFNNISYTGGTFNAGDTGGSSDGSTGANPIQIVGDNANSAITNVTISNNQVYNCMTAWSEAISLKGNINGFTVSKNIVHDNTNIGIDVYGFGSFPPITTNNQPQNGTIIGNETYKCICHYTDCGALYVDGAKNITIINNKVHDNTYGISIGCENQQGASGATASEINVLDNFVYNNSLAGLEIGTSDAVSGHGQTASCLISGNTFLKNSTSNQWGSEAVMQYSTGLTFKNNIFYGLYPQLLTYAWGASNITFNYNDYYYVSGSQSSVVVSYQPSSSTWSSASLATFQSWVGGDANSVFSNPSLVSDVPSNGNFHLNSSSICIDKGDPSFSSPISGETDMDEQARVQNGRIDMGCDEYGSSTILVTGVTVSPTSASITVGATQQLTATVSPSNATNTSVTWSSSNTSIATVNSSGLVTAVAAGSATITVTTVDQGKTATSAITVSALNVAVTGVTISPTSATITIGGTQQLSATISPSNATNQSVTWSSNNTSVATVSSSGLVTGIAVGSATITVTTADQGKTATSAITVTSSGSLPSPWQTSDIGTVGATGNASYSGNTFTVNGSGWDIYTPNDAFRFVYQSMTGDGTITARVVSMTNSNGWAKAGVMIRSSLSSSAGYGLTALTPSNGLIFESESSGTVTQSQVTGISAPNWVRVTRSGNTLTSYYSPDGSNWTQISSQSVNDLGSTAYIGLADCSHQDGTLCTATFDNVTVINGTVTVTGVTVSPTSANITVGGTQQLTAIVSPSNASNQSVTWSSSNTSVATVNSSGLVTAVGAGSATITVTTVDQGKTATSSITVNTNTVNIVIDGNLSDWSSINAIATASGQTSLSLKVYDDANYFYFGISGSGMNATNYHIFLNTDNNTSTGYQDPDFTSTGSGADYMIENGTLYHSTGTGWSWSAVSTTVTASKNTSVTEVSVPRTALGTLSNTIKVAYTDVSSSWTTVSKLGYSSYTKLKSADEDVNNLQNNELTEVKVYPNPATEVLNINLGSSTGLAQISIYAADGRLMYRGQTAELLKQINVADLKMTGLAIVEIEKNGQISRIKILIGLNK